MDILRLFFCVYIQTVKHVGHSNEICRFTHHETAVHILGYYSNSFGIYTLFLL